jgi:cytochrome d ubiquinol oxidase subunit I
MLRGRNTRYYRLGFIIPFTVAAIAAPVQMAVGDTLARWVYNNQPAKFAAIELVATTGNHEPEILFGHENDDGTVSGGIRIPGLASFLSDPRTGTSTVVQGRNAFPADAQPTIAQTNVVHLSWDIMVGLGTLLTLLSIWYALSWLFRRDMPRTRWFLRIAACAGVAAVITMEAGWVVTEVGRQPWIVYNYMRVSDAATTNGGVWITLLMIIAIYLVVGVTTILVLRGMSRRWRAAQGGDEADVPYGPSVPPEYVREEVPVG